MKLQEKLNQSKLWRKIMSGPFGKLIQQFISFGIIGIFNTLLGVVLIELFYNIFHWNYWVSSITSYVIGSIIILVGTIMITKSIKKKEY